LIIDLKPSICLIVFLFGQIFLGFDFGFVPIDMFIANELGQHDNSLFKR